MSRNKAAELRRRVRRRRRQHGDGEYRQVAEKRPEQASHDEVVEEGFRKLQDRATGMVRGSQKPIFYRREGKHKVSQAVLELVQDELDDCDGQDITVREIIQVGIIAWNLAATPASHRPLMLKGIREKAGRGLPLQGAIALEIRLLELAARKMAMFPNYRDFILDYELTVSGDWRHLVVSTAPLEMPEPEA